MSSSRPSGSGIEGIDLPRGETVFKIDKKIARRPTLAGLQNCVMKIRKAPINLPALLDTGILDGFRVIYGKEHGGMRKELKELRLPGWIDDIFVVCDCRKCDGTKKMSLSAFEMHARSKNTRGERVFLHNGKSLNEVLEAGRAAKRKGIEEVRNVLLEAMKDAMTQEICVECGKRRGEVACSRCSNVYHLECAGLTKNLLDWPCPKCRPAENNPSA